MFLAPFDVRLNADQADDTVVQPDLLVVCDQSKLDGTACKGAPDLVVEILSPSSVAYDRMVKFKQYRKAGVTEYWIVDPETKTVEHFLLRGAFYVADMSAQDDLLPVQILPGCTIDLSKIFSK